MHSHTVNSQFCEKIVVDFSFRIRYNKNIFHEKGDML